MTMKREQFSNQVGRVAIVVDNKYAFRRELGSHDVSGRWQAATLHLRTANMGPRWMRRTIGAAPWKLHYTREKAMAPIVPLGLLSVDLLSLRAYPG
jgi:hypothetical protein